MDITELALPCALTAIQHFPARLGKRRQRIAFCRMEPSAAQIQWHALEGRGAGAPAQPRQGLDEEHGSMQPGQTARGCNTRRAATDNRYVNRIGYLYQCANIITGGCERSSGRRFVTVAYKPAYCARAMIGRSSPGGLT
jgi:hypothetical protein